MLDRVGFAASALCAIHCATMPLVFTFLPLLGLEFLANHWFEAAMIIFSTVIGLRSLVPSYRHIHRNSVPIILLFAGLLMVYGVHVLRWHNLETFIMPIGGFIIASAHYINWKLRKQFAETHEKTCAQ